MQGYDDGIAKILWHLAMFPAAVLKTMKLVMKRRPAMESDFWLDAVNSYCFSTLKLIYGSGSLFEVQWSVEFLFQWKLRSAMSSSVLRCAVNTEEALEVLRLTSEHRGVVS